MTAAKFFKVISKEFGWNPLVTKKQLLVWQLFKLINSYSKLCSCLDCNSLPHIVINIISKRRPQSNNARATELKLTSTDVSKDRATKLCHHSNAVGCCLSHFWLLVCDVLNQWLKEERLVVGRDLFKKERQPCFCKQPTYYKSFQNITDQRVNKCCHQPEQ